MIRNWAPFLFWLMGAAASAAETVRVQSGDHDNFTRLVLYLPGQIDWEAERKSANSVRLTLSRPEIEFDMDGVFDVISTDRLAQLTSDKRSQLDIGLACECAVAVYPYATRFLVVDIANRLRASALSPDAVVLQPAKPELKPQLSDQGGDTSEVLQIADAMVDLEEVSEPLGLLESGSEAATVLAQSEWNSPPTIALPDPLETTVAAPTPMPVLPVLPDLTVGKNSTFLAEQLDAEVQAATQAGLLSMADHMTISSAAEPETATIDPQLEEDTGDATGQAATVAWCPPNVASMIAQWAGHTPYSQELARMRAETVDLTGRAVPSAELALARFYVAYGQGYEALALLAPMDGAAADTLRAMASVIEGRVNVSKTVFAACPGLSPWDVIRRVNAGDQSPGLDEDAVIAAYQLLPPVLLAMFEMPTMRYLEQNGYGHAHGTLAAFLTRTVAPSEQSPTTQDGAEVSAVAEPSHDVPIKLLDRFQSIKDAQAASENDRRLIEAYRKEYRDTRLAAAFWVSELRVMLAETRFDAAIALLDEGAGQHPEMFGEAYAETAVFVTENADDITFLKMAMAIETGGYDWPPPPAKVAKAVGARLELLGF